jgi:MYXO-CTERM domain-containing protein
MSGYSGEASDWATTEGGGRFSLRLFDGPGTLQVQPPEDSGFASFNVPIDVDGDSTLALLLQFLTDSVSETVSAGQSVTTDDENDGATPQDPIETIVMSPNPGEVTIEEQPITESEPPGYEFLTQQIHITAPPATSADDPLVLTFLFDASRLPDGVDQTNVEIFRNGVLVPDCTGAVGTADPDPCVSSRVYVAADDDIEIVVLTTAASNWNIGIAQELSGDDDAGAGPDPDPDPLPGCGDGEIDATEICDGEDFGTASCSSLGRGFGSLRCSSDCRSIDTGLCDGDGDGVVDRGDNCPDDANPKVGGVQPNADGDARGDACDSDDDNDGIADDLDEVPDDPTRCSDLDEDSCDDCSSGVFAPGNDGCEGVSTCEDGGVDVDADGFCGDDDDDLDGDAVANEEDNCPDLPNADQIDSDGDGLGDACDADVDSGDDDPTEPEDDMTEDGSDLDAGASETEDDPSTDAAADPSSLDAGPAPGSDGDSTELDASAPALDASAADDESPQDGGDSTAIVRDSASEAPDDEVLDSGRAAPRDAASAPNEHRLEDAAIVDASRSADAGTSGADDSGCDCRVAGRSGNTNHAAYAALLLAGALFSRRRRWTARSGLLRAGAK